MATASDHHVGPQPDPLDPSSAIDVELPREPTCAASARRLIEDRFASALDPEMLDDLKTIASELVNNAYEHGRGKIGIKVSESDHRIKLEVSDEGENAVVAIRPNAFDGRGNGLRIVDLLADNWGVFNGATQVWASVARAPNA